MLIQGQVGPSTPQSVAPGTPVAVRQGQLGDVVVSELHGRYYEQAYRKNLFAGAIAGSTGVINDLDTIHGLAYYQNNTTGDCNNGNCTSNCNCGDHNCSNCLISGTVDCSNCDSQSYLQPNCNCNCTYNCTTSQTSINCNCNCSFICACACW